MKLWSFHREYAATQQMRRDRLALRVKNDDEVLQKKRSRTVPRNTVEKAFQDKEIIQIIKSIVIFHE
jgi:hypothetical protein